MQRGFECLWVVVLVLLAGNVSFSSFSLSFYFLDFSSLQGFFVVAILVLLVKELFFNLVNFGSSVSRLFNFDCFAHMGSLADVFSGIFLAQGEEERNLRVGSRGHRADVSSELHTLLETH